MNEIDEDDENKRREGGGGDTNDLKKCINHIFHSIFRRINRYKIELIINESFKLDVYKFE